MILLTSCLVNNEIEKPNYFASISDKESFSKIIQYDYEVQWNSITDHYSEELGKNYLEFPIMLSNENLIKGNYRISFTLLAIQKDDVNFEFYVVKFYQEVKNDLDLGPNVSFSIPGRFSGLVHVLDNNNEIYFAQKFKDGDILEQRLFTQKGQASDNGRMSEDCYTVTTYHYTDWYVNGVYTDSWLNYISYETFCYNTYLPDLYTYGGGGSGSYGSSIGGDAYNNCGDPVHGCIFKLNDKLLNGEIFEAQINDAALKPCMQPIVADLKNITKGVGSIVTKFAGNNQGWNWTLQDGSLPGGTNANTSQQYNTSTGTVTTTFDASKFTNATNLSIARTILHESVHAYLVVYFRTDPLAASRTYSQLLQDYYQHNNANTAHHIEMTRSFVNEIALALEEYGTSKGYNLTSQFYKDLAWGGLTTTPAFQALSTTDQNRINNTILTEQTGKDSQGNTQQQKGTNAGC